MIKKNNKENKIVDNYLVCLLISALLLFGMKFTLSYFRYDSPDEVALIVPTCADVTLYIVMFIRCIVPSVSLCLIYCYLVGKSKIYNIREYIKIFVCVFSAVIIFRTKSVVDCFEVNIGKETGYIKLYVRDGLAFPTVELVDVFSYVITWGLLLSILAWMLNPKFLVKKTSTVVRRVSIICFYPIMLISSMFLFVGNWILKTFGTITADKLIFQIRSSQEGVNSEFIKLFFIQCLFPAIIISIIITLLCLDFFIKGNGLWELLHRIKVNNYVIVCILFILPIIVAGYYLKELSDNICLDEYIRACQNNSHFIDDNYVDPLSTSIVFSKGKRNLIYIYLESMENSFLSQNEGGMLEVNLIPELQVIAENNIYFSNTNSHGGAISVIGTDWTIAAMVSQSAGVPLLIPIDGNMYGEYDTFMPGTVSLGDILNKEGYNQTLIVGSDSKFGGRKNLYEQHGNYKILDLYTAWEDGTVPYGRVVEWGFEDKILYEYAKKELDILSSKNKPFNLTILTVDTHHPSGYQCELCESEYRNAYWNSIRCASRQVESFLNWLKEQEYYDDTTIVIVGDHPSMSADVSNNMKAGYVRTTYNAFINSACNSENTHNRLFTNWDMFPTTLAAMGATIEGNKLGLGVNLFSNQPTLLEKYEISDINRELSGKSKLYDELLFGK